ncbi:MAG: nuclear transport factor 2 family protein [Planctomycetes bacterium]|nr:nuclear transport factor 2 family protein [Planctomycetota bacterium]
MQLVPVASLVLASTLAALAMRPEPAAPAPFGPGAVLGLQKQLFAAIDAGDEAKAAALLDDTKEGGWSDGENGGIERPTLMLLDARGLPVFAHGADAARALLAATARASKDGGPEWTTRIVRSRADCPSGELSYAVLEFERSRGVKGGVQRYRSTVLARWTDGRMKLVHWHVSAADESTAKLAAADSKR